MPDASVASHHEVLPVAARAGTALIALRDITKVYLANDLVTRALAGISLDIAQGEFVAIEGPSGCGKSTLLSILGLLETATDGEYRLAGEPVASFSKAHRTEIRNRQIGFIFQAFNLIGDLTAFENVELPLTYRHVPAHERRARVNEALERVRMQERARYYPTHLSGGQQQRVAVARAIAGDPLILLADEPTGNLDSSNGDSVMELLTELHRSGATICMVTHDSRYARYASRAVRLFDGCLR